MADIIPNQLLPSAIPVPVADGGTGSTSAAAALSALGAASQAEYEIGQVFSSTTTIPGGGGAGKAGSMKTSPVIIVSIPGAGKFLEVVSAHIFLDFASVPYDNTGNTTIQFTSPATICTDIISDAGFNNVASDQHRTIYAAKVAPVENTSLSLRTLDDWYTAAGDSPVKVEVLYRIRDYTI